MKRVVYILIAGLAAAGLASCDKQDLKTSSIKDVYSIVIEKDLQTKASVTMVNGEERRIRAILKKNGTPIDCNSFTWSPGSGLKTVRQGSETYNGPTNSYKGIKCGYIDVKAISNGSVNLTASTDSKNTGGQEISGKTEVSIKGVSSLTFTVAKTSLIADESTTYMVKATYSDNTSADVTSLATVTSSNPTMLSASGGTVRSNKQMGCLGSFTLTASYGGKTPNKTITVSTDYVSDDIKLSWSSDKGSGSNISSGSFNGYVKRNDQSQVTVSFSGNLKTSNNDTYAVSNNLIEFYETWSNETKKSSSNTYWAEEEDVEIYELRYLGETIKTWTITWRGN